MKKPFVLPINGGIVQATGGEPLRKDAPYFLHNYVPMRSGGVRRIGGSKTLLPATTGKVLAACEAKDGRIYLYRETPTNINAEQIDNAGDSTRQASNTLSKPVPSFGGDVIRGNQLNEVYSGASANAVVFCDGQGFGVWCYDNQIKRIPLIAGVPGSVAAKCFIQHKNSIVFGIAEEVFVSLAGENLFLDVANPVPVLNDKLFGAGSSAIPVNGAVLDFLQVGDVLLIFTTGGIQMLLGSGADDFMLRTVLPAGHCQQPMLYNGKIVFLFNGVPSQLSGDWVNGVGEAVSLVEGVYQKWIRPPVARSNDYAIIKTWINHLDGQYAIQTQQGYWWLYSFGLGWSMLDFGDSTYLPFTANLTTPADGGSHLLLGATVAQYEHLHKNPAMEGAGSTVGAPVDLLGQPIKAALITQRQNLFGVGRNHRLHSLMVQSNERGSLNLRASAVPEDVENPRISQIYDDALTLSIWLQQADNGLEQSVLESASSNTEEACEMVTSMDGVAAGWRFILASNSSEWPFDVANLVIEASPRGRNT